MKPHCSEDFETLGQLKAFMNYVRFWRIRFQFRYWRRRYLVASSGESEKHLWKSVCTDFSRQVALLTYYRWCCKNWRSKDKYHSRVQEKKNHASWLKNSCPRSILLQFCWIVIHSSLSVRNIKLLSNSKFRQSRSQNSLFNRDFQPMLLGSPKKVDSSRVKVIGMMNVSIHLGLMARTAKTTTKQNVSWKRLCKIIFGFYHWCMFVLMACLHWLCRKNMWGRQQL